jgi:hypothetical protein
MKKLLVTAILALTMTLGFAAPAQAEKRILHDRMMWHAATTKHVLHDRMTWHATPMYGSRFTARHGWIVWADNGLRYPIRTRCHWTAGGYRWSTNWIIYPLGYKWTTSDAGSWGNRRPQGLSCSYVRWV